MHLPNRFETTDEFAYLIVGEQRGHLVTRVKIDLQDITRVIQAARWFRGSKSAAVCETPEGELGLARFILGLPKRTKTKFLSDDHTDYRRSNLKAVIAPVIIRRPNRVPNNSRIEQEHAVIELTNQQGLVQCEAIVDIIDLQRVLDYGRWWKASKSNSWTLYASSDGKKETGRVKMHRLVMQAQGKLQVDHINGNGLDNRRDNLRFVTQTENQQNRPRANKNNSSSGTKNVYFHKASGRWVVLIVVEGKRWSGGYFVTQAEAEAKATQMREELHTHSPENRDIGVL